MCKHIALHIRCLYTISSIAFPYHMVIYIWVHIFLSDAVVQATAIKWKSSSSSSRKREKSIKKDSQKQKLEKKVSMPCTVDSVFDVWHSFEYSRTYIESLCVCLCCFFAIFHAGEERRATCKYDWRCVVGSIWSVFILILSCFFSLYIFFLFNSQSVLYVCVCFSSSFYLLCLQCTSSNVLSNVWYTCHVYILHVLDFASLFDGVDSAVGYCVTAIRLWCCCVYCLMRETLTRARPQ